MLGILVQFNNPPINGEQRKALKPYCNKMKGMSSFSHWPLMTTWPALSLELELTTFQSNNKKNMCEDLKETLYVKEA